MSVAVVCSWPFMLATFIYILRLFFFSLYFFLVITFMYFNVQLDMYYVLTISLLYQCMSTGDRNTSFAFPVHIGDCCHFSKQQLTIHTYQRQSTDTPWIVDRYTAVMLWLRWQQKVNQCTDRVSTNNVCRPMAYQLE